QSRLRSISWDPPGTVPRGAVHPLGRRGRRTDRAPCRPRRRRRDAAVASDQYTIPDEDRTEALQVIPRAPEWSGDRAWINEYYRHVPQEDLLARTEDQLRERADHHHEVGRVRAPREIAVGVR